MWVFHVFTTSQRLFHIPWGGDQQELAVKPPRGFRGYAELWETPSSAKGLISFQFLSFLKARNCMGWIESHLFDNQMVFTYSLSSEISNLWCFSCIFIATGICSNSPVTCSIPVPCLLIILIVLVSILFYPHNFRGFFIQISSLSCHRVIQYDLDLPEGANIPQIPGECHCLLQFRPLLHHSIQLLP